MGEVGFDTGGDVGDTTGLATGGEVAGGEVGETTGLVTGGDVGDVTGAGAWVLSAVTHCEYHSLCMSHTKSPQHVVDPE